MKRNELLLSFYGDDFTGSTDVMETLAMNGIPTLLFLKTPTKAEIENTKLKRNVGGDKLRAFGVAGIARSLGPKAMEIELNPIFSALSQFRTDYFLYKVCSTLDSSPTVGNIGTAMEVALKYFSAELIPCVIGAPFLNRFVVFGNLFARLDEKTYRLDRHPVMSVHPVTPMTESDISQHLAIQTQIKTRSVDFLQMQSGDIEKLMPPEKRAGEGSLVIFDTLNNNDLEFIGKHLYLTWSGSTQLLLGSSGISYGLAKFLAKQKGEITPDQNDALLTAVSKIFVISGSCSPVSERQINYSLDRGFVGVRLDVVQLMENKHPYLESLMEEVNEALDNGKSVVVFTALGPADPSIGQLRKKNIPNMNTVIGESAGYLVSQVIENHGKLRCVVVGGDTSGYVSRALGIYALEMIAPVAPGAPLCVAHASDATCDGLEIALKGGQNGKDDYFQKILGKNRKM